ncbi:MAG: DUF2161 family putative PD-(D/E)XK-type phosphodiesterase [Anaerolineae bacterium]
MKETDLYGPLRSFLEAQGYVVRGEVRGCDIAAAKGDDLVVIEMKLTLNVDLLIQAVQRKRLAESVYIALPAPLGRSNRERWRGVLQLLRCLEVGLLLVHLDTAEPTVEICLQPLPTQRRRNLRERRAVLREVAGRSADLNTGGSRRGPLVTAYREAALYVAYCLLQQGPLSPRALRRLGAGAKVLPMLARNHYGWFERVGRARYALTTAGEAGLAAREELCQGFAERLRLATDVEAGPETT